MPVYRDVSAAIHVDGKALEEYQVEYDEPQKLVSCWIPSQVGKEFSIQVRNTNCNNHFRFTVKMDGDHTNCRVISPQATEIIDRCQPSPTTYRSFVFSRGQPVDDDKVSVDLTHAAGVGSIAIKVWTGKWGSMKMKSLPVRNISIPERRMIPERAKKGIETCVALGPVKTRIPEKMRKGREFIRTEFHASFVFRYRPLDFLQAQGIAPPPSPPATSSNNGTRAGNTLKRKRSSSLVRPEAGPSKPRRTCSRTEAVRDILSVEISDEQDLEKLRALRSKIDEVLAERDPGTRPKKEHKPIVISKSEVIDLT